MRRIYSGKTFAYLTVAVLGLAACNSASPTSVVSEQVVVEFTQEPTAILPTASAFTATPTKGPPTATSTLTVRPSATPTSVPTFTPVPAPKIYVVEEFDTLLGIAVEFDTTVEALTLANGVNEYDFLQIGQELIIPAPGEEVVLSTAAAQTDAFANISEPATQADTDAESAIVDVTANKDEEVVVGVDTQTEAAETAVPGGSTGEGAPSESTLSVPVSDQSPLPAVAHAANINPLTGLPVSDPARLRRRPLLIRVGNDAAARQSQAGLNSADVVYEEITEWWVTRFTAIFLSNTPGVVGPIRSARLINVQLAPQYQGALAHSGGSDPVRWEISQAPLVNLDEFYNALPYFYRPNEGWQTRLGINTVAARDYMASKGSEAPVALNGFLFSNSISGGEPGEQLFIPYPHATSRTEWHYDAAGGKYLRWTTEAPLYDVGAGTQVAASNVIVYFAEHQDTDIVEDSNGATSIRIIVNGKGPAWFFRDGKLNKGFWQTDGARTPYFGYQDGRPYALKPGNTWIEVVPTYFTIGLNSPDEASSRP